jgi:hypothetical protein
MLRFSHFAVATGHVPVDRKGAHGKQIALAGEHHGRNLLDEIGRPLGNEGRTAVSGADRVRHGNLVQVSECAWSTTSQFRRTTSGPRLP